jgi:hypothetical protein
MTTIYSIKNWDIKYETHETRKFKKLCWIPIPIKHDGNGFRRLMSLEDSGNIFAAFILSLEVAAKCPKRGVLADENGPLNSKDLEIITGLNCVHFDKMFDKLSDPKIRICWIVKQNSPDTPGESPDAPGFSPGRIEQNRTEENKIREREREREREELEPPSASLPAAPGDSLPQETPDPEKRALEEKRTQEASQAWKDFVSCWNSGKWAKIRPEAPHLKDRNSLKLRMKCDFWAKNWRIALKSAETSQFLKGDNGRGWSMTVEFFLRKNTVERILEGEFGCKIHKEQKKPDLLPWIGEVRLDPPGESPSPATSPSISRSLTGFPSKFMPSFPKTQMLGRDGTGLGAGIVTPAQNG